MEKARANTGIVLTFMQNERMPAPAANREFSTVELADASGVPVTTLRMYQQRGLLDPPERRGRNAIYRQSHLDRLAVIRHLQDRGYSLAAIADVARNGSGAVAAVIEQEVPILAGTHTTLTLLELMQSLPAADFSLETIARAQQLELLSITGPTVTITQPTFLEAGAVLTAMGVPTDRILDAYEMLQLRVHDIAADFASLFDEHVLVATEPVDLNVVTAQLDTLTRTAINVVSAELRRALRDAAVTRITELTGSRNA